MPGPSIEVMLDERVGEVHPHVYGHFVEHLGGCVYGGIWDGSGPCAQVVELLRGLRPGILRWPGGCFADDYHWRDGVGPPAARPRTVNLHWGNVVEDNSFGTHEFIALCRAVGAEPYLCGNVGSGSPRELRDWVEYCNFPGGSTLSDLRRANGAEAPFGVRYWGIGNEAWGCGGSMSPEEYAAEYRRHATYVRAMGGVEPFLIACGPDGDDLEWTRRFFEKLVRDAGRRFDRIHGYTPHYYCGTAGDGSATDFAESDWYELLLKASRIEELVVRQRAAMDEFDPDRRIAMMIDEWGTWHFPTPGRNPAFLWQQNALRDAMVAAITLDAFGRHAEVVKMSSVAQAVNVLMAPILAEGGRAIRTPTYLVYQLYANHIGGTSVRVEVAGPSVLFHHAGELRRIAALAGSATLKGRTLTLTVTNVHLDEAVEATVRLRGDAGAGPSAILVRETVLTDDDMAAHNTFDEPERVRLTDPRVLPLSGREMTYAFAPRSVTRLEMSLA